MSRSIFVISAPSGAGKTTVINRVLDKISSLKLAISFTTRSPRSNEKEGVDYNFVGRDEFEKLARKKGFLEWAEVHGDLYGTPASEIESATSGEEDILLDIDVQGAARVRGRYPDAVLIFLLPPSFEELKKRIETRGQNKPKDIKKRLDDAREEMKLRHEYDYQVINDDLDEAVEEITEIIEYYRNLE